MYVYEINRHGARSPLRDIPTKVSKNPSTAKGVCEPIEGFNLPAGQLTAQGMRQRYLLGRYNKMRYGNLYKLVDHAPNTDEIYIQSTDVYRTIQSAYSEVLGMYGDDVGPENDRGSSLHALTESQLVSITDTENKKRQGRLLPLKVRRFNDMQSALMDQSVPDGFVSVPVYTQIDTQMTAEAKSLAKKKNLAEIEQSAAP